MRRSSDLRSYYLTEGATVAAKDIPKGHVAYGSAGRIVGTNDVLLLDLFEGAAGTLIQNHVPDINVAGNAYANVEWGSPYTGGILKLHGAGYAYQTTTDCIALGVIDTGQTDVEVSSDVIMCNGTTYGSQGIIFRYVDIDNHWELVRSSSTLLTLTEYTGGSPTTRDSFAATLSNNSRYNFKIRVSGDNITGYIDDVERVSYTGSAHNTSTTHGIIGISFSTPGASQHHHLKIRDIS